MKLRVYTPDDYMEIVGRTIEKAVNESCLIIFFGSILTDKFSRTSNIDVEIFCGASLTPKEYLKEFLFCVKWIWLILQKLKLERSLSKFERSVRL